MMARQKSAPRSTASRSLATILLSLEAVLWIGGMLFLVGPGIEGAIVVLVAGSLSGLSLLAIFLLSRSHGAGLAIGLGLQGLLVLYGLGVTALFWQLFGLVAVAFGVVTSLCLAAVANERSRA
jgi:hypothetical protein